VMRVATFFPFQTTYYLNGHNFMEQELKRANVGFRNYAERTIMRSALSPDLRSGSLSTV
jgi:hypothetical protein